MDKKIITLLIILIFSVGCLSFVSADNNTADNLTAENIGENLTANENYIIPVYITDNGIEFSDGFIGFCIDSTKDIITANDQFTSEPTKNEEIQNNVKLAIIECYKAGKENDIQNVVSQVLKGNKNYDVVESILNSTQTVDDTTVVNINNTTEATFTFELLKPVDDGKSDCLAYKISLKTIKNDDVLGSGNDTVESADNESSNLTDNTENITGENDNNSDSKTKTNDVNDNTNENKNASDDKKSNDGQTTISETNKTVINRTNTTIINENNTTIINQKNTKIINKTNETPHNATLPETIMRVVGNPITILVIVIVVIAIVGIVMRRKG